MYKPVYTFRYGELALKKKQRTYWEFILKNNILAALKLRGIDTSSFSIIFNQKRGFIVLPPEEITEDVKKAIEDTLAKTPGVTWWGELLYVGTPQDPWEQIENNIKKIFDNYGYPLEIDVRRYVASEKLSTMFVKRRLWGLEEAIPTRSDKKAIISLDNDISVIYVSPGVGGLPVSSVGKGIILFSGGIDSPVASFLAFKRGIRADLLHFHPPGLDVKESKIYRLFRILKQYNPYLKLYTTYSEQLVHLVNSKKIYNPIVFYRRLILRVAMLLLFRTYKQGFIITGDSLGQVASQTFSNLVAQSSVVCEEKVAEKVLIVRPLAGFDKQEITELARKVGTYEESIKEYKDCCDMLSRGAKTITNLERMQIQEKEVNVETLINEALDNLSIFTE